MEQKTYKYLCHCNHTDIDTMATLHEMFKESAVIDVRICSESKRFKLLMEKLIPIMRESSDDKYKTHAAMKRHHAQIKTDIVNCLPDVDVKQMNQKSLHNRVDEVIANARAALFPEDERVNRASKKRRKMPTYIEEGAEEEEEEDAEEEDEIHVDGEEHGHHPEMSAERVLEITQERMEAVRAALLPFTDKGWLTICGREDCRDAIEVKVEIRLPFRSFTTIPLAQPICPPQLIAGSFAMKKAS